ncbi:hypothetical protein [Thiocapsa sp.]|uniref:hypothetical protein n=1 Tax=Thiocapsa sp. TaxID=2024551 RepID=UPI003593D6F3
MVSGAAWRRASRWWWPRPSSGINVNETLGNPNFRPHPALGALLTGLKTHGADTPTRNAAAVAASLFQTWAAKNQSTVKQLELFDDLGEAA